MRHPWIVRYIVLFVSSALAYVASAEPQVDWEQEISLSLRDADLIEVMSSFSAIAGGELVADEELEGAVTIELVAVPFARSIDRVCVAQGLACYWVDGSPPTLEVKSPDVGFVGFADSLQLSLRDADLVDVLESMRAITQDALALETGLAGSISVELRKVPWPVALEEICRLGGCRVDWGSRPIRVAPATVPRRRGEPGSATMDAADAKDSPLLVVTPLAAARRASIDLRIRVDGAEISPVRFTWARPVARRALDAVRRLVLVWIPFDHQVVLPLFVDCVPGVVTVLDPVALPLATRVIEHFEGSLVELTQAGDSRAGDGVVVPAPPTCIADEPIVVRLEYGEIEEKRATRVELGADVGDYLLVTPPTGDVTPAAAVIRLGAAGARIALVRPDAAGGASVETHSLDRAAFHTTIDTVGRELRLEVRVAAPAS
ncbi:MAG: hypothetical protein AAGC60_09925 [Acidobacteriota bacterium]